PIFPSDATDFLLALTNIRFSQFLWIIIIGCIPRYLLVNSLGEDLHRGITWTSAIMIFVIIILIVIALERERIKYLMFKELKEVEKEVQKIENEI
ncbi:MAG: hypothetical protein AABX05_05710, partial [Nanoarchaeota archaeon]